MKNLVSFGISILILSCNTIEKVEQKTEKMYPKRSYEESTRWADSLVNQMTLKEKTKLIGGVDIFFTQANERLNIPRVMMTDASSGIHLRDSFKEINYEKVLDKSTAFPCPIMLASTWNKDLAYKFAHSIGEECRAGGIQVLLGPGMNIYRHSQCGRNFEYMGEDPYLVARMIENYVKGVQNTGTIATLKHFVANNTDYYRRKSNSIVDERTLHEIYTPAFKAGIDAGAMSVMTAYNLLNNEWCGESSYVINDLLRKQLGFKWLVITDWWSVYDGEKLIKSGQDLEMPYTVAASNAKELIEDGKIEEKDIDRMVTSILRTYYAMDSYNMKADSSLLANYDQHLEIALQTAREGIVLLKNNGVLPLSVNNNPKILVTGFYLDKLAEGGGSAKVTGYNRLLLKDALKAEFGDKILFKVNPDQEDIKNADIVLFSAGTSDSEGWDRPFELPEEQENSIKLCVKNNPNTIVIVQSGSGIRMTDWVNQAGAILYAWYGGQIGNQAVAEVLSGKINPSGKLPITIEKEFKDSPGYGYIPEGEKLYIDWNDAEEKKRNIYNLKYNEGIFVGYRWYEKKNVEPLFPFGFGLSYTTFEYSDLQLQNKEFKQNAWPEISLMVRNTGSVKGYEIVQLYIRDNECSYPRPLKELKGFQKIMLNPGESANLKFKLTQQDFSFWNPEIKDWSIEPGTFTIMIGSSSSDIHLKEEINYTE